MPRALSASEELESNTVLSLQRTIVRFHKGLSADPFHGYWSWGHCYRYFLRRVQLRDDRDVDRGALHLALPWSRMRLARGVPMLLRWR
jgi:hypothetical protein